MSKNSIDYSSYPKWELLAMKKALSLFPILNTPEENQRLIDVKKALKEK